MADLRNNPITEFAGMKVEKLWDLSDGTITNVANGEKEPLNLPKSNVLKFELENNAWFAARPSGTEPKIKFYFGVNEANIDAANEKISICIKELEKLI